MNLLDYSLYAVLCVRSRKECGDVSIFDGYKSNMKDWEKSHNASEKANKVF